MSNVTTGYLHRNVFERLYNTPTAASKGQRFDPLHTPESESPQHYVRPEFCRPLELASRLLKPTECSQGHIYRESTTVSNTSPLPPPPAAAAALALPSTQSRTKAKKSRLAEQSNWRSDNIARSSAGGPPPRSHPTSRSTMARSTAVGKSAIVSSPHRPVQLEVKLRGSSSTKTSKSNQSSTKASAAFKSTGSVSSRKQNATPIPKQTSTPRRPTTGGSSSTASKGTTKTMMQESPKSILSPAADSVFVTTDRSAAANIISPPKPRKKNGEHDITTPIGWNPSISTSTAGTATTDTTTTTLASTMDTSPTILREPAAELPSPDPTPELISPSVDASPPQPFSPPDIPAEVPVPPSTKEEAVQWFHRIDTKGSGILSLEEVNEGIDKLYPNLKHKSLAFLAYQASDSNETGLIHEDEFDYFVNFLVYFNNLWDHFVCVDESEDLRIPMETFIPVAERLALFDNVRDVFMELDTAKCGYILLDDLCAKCARRKVELSALSKDTSTAEHDGSDHQGGVCDNTTTLLLSSLSKDEVVRMQSLEPNYEDSAALEGLLDELLE